MLNFDLIKPSSTYIVQQTVEEVGIDDHPMNTTKWDKEEKADEGSMVSVPHTGVDPWTVVVHFGNASRIKGQKRWVLNVLTPQKSCPLYLEQTQSTRPTIGTL